MRISVVSCLAATLAAQLLSAILSETVSASPRVGIVELQFAGTARERHASRGEMSQFTDITLRHLGRTGIDEASVSSLPASVGWLGRCGNVAEEACTSLCGSTESCLAEYLAESELDGVVAPTLGRSEATGFYVELQHLDHRGLWSGTSSPLGSRVESRELDAFFSEVWYTAPIEVAPQPPVVQRAVRVTSAADPSEFAPSTSSPYFWPRSIAAGVVAFLTLIVFFFRRRQRTLRREQDALLDWPLVYDEDGRAISAVDLFWDLGGNAVAIDFLLKRQLIPASREGCIHTAALLQDEVAIFGDYSDFVLGHRAAFSEVYGVRPNVAYGALQTSGEPAVQRQFSKPVPSIPSVPLRSLVENLHGSETDYDGIPLGTAVASYTALSKYLRHYGGPSPAAFLRSAEDVALHLAEQKVMLTAGLAAAPVGVAIWEDLSDGFDGDDLLVGLAVGAVSALLSGQLFRSVANHIKARHLRRLSTELNGLLHELWVAAAVDSEKFDSNVRRLARFAARQFQEQSSLVRELDSQDVPPLALRLVARAQAEAGLIAGRLLADANRFLQLVRAAASGDTAAAGLQIYYNREVVLEGYEVSALLARIEDMSSQVDAEHKLLVQSGVLAP